MLPFTPLELEAAVADGHVTKRPHPTLPLHIYNYSPSVQFDKRWNTVTLNCRGLILDEDYNIVARPWKKFFNLGEVELPMQLTDPVEIMDKADGSLGILYPVGEYENAIATRGSFASEQAIKATEIWNAKYDHLHPSPDYTLLFEIIFPSNRIVLDYGDTEDLILLGAVENATGYYISPLAAQGLFVSHDEGEPSWWKGPVVKVFSYNNISEALGYMERKNAEGYVIRSHNFMVKLKQPDYLDLHRLVTNASPRTVWEQLKAGKSKSEIVSAFPDEFHTYIAGMIDPLVEKYQTRLTEVLEGYEHVYAVATTNDDPFNTTRAQYARVFKKHKDAKYFFSLLDNRSIMEVLWAELKPTTEE